MPKALHKLINIFITIILLVTCTSCNKGNNNYTKKAWLYDLGLRAGIIEKKDISYDNLKSKLEIWEVINEDDEFKENDSLNYEFLAYTLSNLLGENDDVSYKYEFNSKYSDDINNFISYKIIDTNIDIYKQLNYFEANEILEKAVDIINNKHFNSSSKIDYIDHVYDEDVMGEGYYSFDNKYEIGDLIKGVDGYYRITDLASDEYKLESIRIEDIIESIDIEDSIMIDFDNVYIEDNYESYHETSNYEDANFKRRANINLGKSFEYNGFKISYSANANKLHLHISKKTDRGINVYYDGDIYDIRPSFKWKYDKGVIEDAYLKVDFRANNEVGLSTGKYKTLYGDFNELDKNAIFDSLKTLLKDQKDVIDTSFTICKIHMPIPQIPLTEFTVELKVNLYVSGKVDIVMDGLYNVGLEIKNNHLRAIFDKRHDIDTNINASTSETTSLIFALEMANQDLVNVRTNFGAKAKASSTAHLYDDLGNVVSSKSEEDYDLISEYQDNKDIFVCGDLSLSWILNLELNSSDSLASRFGLNKVISILDENDQIFKNKTHIENGHFVDKCTRNKRPSINNGDKVEVNPDRIILEKYSLVMKTKNDTIPIKSLPKGYSNNDLVFESSKSDVVVVDKFGNLTGVKNGVSKIRISTHDGKYEIFLNVLVSNETV